ncbi:MAG: hydrolase [Clostridiales bacterium]|nr:MAG: hydrolase [Clostridiales bacterium]
MKTLFVTDLDKTLLRSEERLSEYSVKTINKLIGDGMCFSYATARSSLTADKVASQLKIKVPLIVFNGAFIVDSVTKKIILSNYFNSDEVKTVREVLIKNRINPIVYADFNGTEKFTFFRGDMNYGKKFFLDSRQNDPRRNETDDPKAVYDKDGKTFYFSCIGDKKDLEPAYESLKSDIRFHCILQLDAYCDTYWLEILPAKATKAHGILQLKTFLKCEKVVCFGDGKNDLEMFKAADECYAVENAVPELKKVATGIIASNDEDGVAKWLEVNWERYER